MVAHFLDKGFYTLKQSSENADQKAALFALCMRLFLMVLVIYSFITINNLVRRETFLGRHGCIWFLHTLTFGVLNLFQLLYEITLIIWIKDGTS